MRKGLKALLGRSSDQTNNESAESSTAVLSDDGTKDPARHLHKAVKAYTDCHGYITTVLNLTNLAEHMWTASTSTAPDDGRSLRSENDLHRRLAAITRRFQETVNKTSAISTDASKTYMAGITQIGEDLREQQPEVARSILTTARKLEPARGIKSKSGVPELARCFFAALEPKDGQASDA
jgi:hypothetical protein